MRRAPAAFAFACVLALALAGCGGSGGDAGSAPAGGAPAGGVPASEAPTAATPSTGETVANDGLSWPAATKTAVGTPSGEAASASIGAAGGTLASPDGRLVLTVPAGALSGMTTVSIQPITATAPGAVGVGYRLKPEGVTFAVPVTLRIGYTDDEIAGGSAQALGIATQAADGSWSRGTASIDTSARTVSVTTKHFSDWTLVEGLQLRPGQASVRVGRSLVLDLSYCYANLPGQERELGYDCNVKELAPLNVGVVGNCAVNGIVGGNATVGTVSYAGEQATYVAPASTPSPATVAVSCDVMPTRANGTKHVLVSNITVTGDYVGTIGGTLSVEGVGTFTMAPATLSGFTVEEESSIPGDVTKWIGRGTATVTATTPRCGTATADVGVEVVLLVWDPASPSADGGMAKAYSISVITPQSAFVPGVCDGRPTNTVPVYLPTALGTDAPGTLGNSQKYGDIATLAGSSDIGYAFPGLGSAVRSQMSWSLTAR